MTQERFEKEVGRPVQRYKQIADAEYIWWFFSDSGNSFWVSVPRASVMDISKGIEQTCFDASIYQLKLQNHNGSVTYFWEVK